jgi:hypothetical protein
MIKEDFGGIDWHAHVRIDKYGPDQIAWCSRKTGIPAERIANYWQGWQFRQWLKNPEDVAEKDGNLLTYVGLAYMLAVLTGVTTTTSAGTLANGYLPVGVGDGGGTVPTASVTDSDLTATTNKWYNPVDAAYPAVGAAGATAGILTVQSTFTSGVANFAWNEWGIYGSTTLFTSGVATQPSGSTMINHKGFSLGTKVSGNSWTLNATIQLS